MGHDHNHNKQNNITKLGSAFKRGIAINVIFIAIEVTFGLLANSMALVADAGHNLSDVLSLIFSWIAVILSQRKPTLKFTYGFRRSTILAALLNTLMLLSAVGLILWETILRIGKPVEIDSRSIIIVAGLGICVNGFTAWLFIKDKKRDLNIRSAFVHFLADALVSSGVVVAGVLIAVTGFVWIDLFMSFMILGVIIYSTYHLLIDSINLSLDAVPENIKIEEVRAYLSTLPEVTGLHDLHIWALGTSTAALTVHLNTNVQTDIGFITFLQRQLQEKFGIDHSTIQIEFGPDGAGCEENCN